MHYANKIFPGFDFILLQIVLQEINHESGKDRIRSDNVAHTKI